MKRLLCLIIIGCFVLSGCGSSEPTSSEDKSEVESTQIVNDLGIELYSESEALNIAEDYEKKFSQYISENNMDIKYKGHEVKKYADYDGYFICSKFEKSPSESYTIEINLNKNTDPVISFYRSMDEDRLFTEDEIKAYTDISKCIFSLYSSDVNTVFSELTTAETKDDYHNFYRDENTRYSLRFSNAKYTIGKDYYYTSFYLEVLPIELYENLHLEGFESIKKECIDTTLCIINDKVKYESFKSEDIIYHISGTLKNAKQQTDGSADAMLNSEDGYFCEAVIFSSDVYHKDFNEYKEFYGSFNEDATIFYIYGME